MDTNLNFDGGLKGISIAPQSPTVATALDSEALDKRW